MTKKAPVAAAEDSNTSTIENKDMLVDQNIEDIPLNPEDPRTAIYAKRDAQLKEQAGELDDLPKEDEEDPPKAGEDDLPKPAEDKLAPGEVTVTINGKEKIVSQSKIDAAGGIAAYQKTAAASELLNQASAEMRRVQEQSAQLQERERLYDRRQQEINQAVKPAAPSELSAPDALRQIAKEYHEAVLDGDMDKAGELLIQMQTARPATVINVEEIAANAVRQVTAKMESEQHAKTQLRFKAEVDEANADYRARFPDIANDEDLSSMANQRTIRLQTEHPDWSPSAIITRAARLTREWITGVRAVSSSEHKLTQKRGQDNIRGGSARAVSRPVAPPQTKSDYVSMVRKQRGLE